MPTDLRSEIRAAFEREQAANAPAPDLRPSIVRAVSAQPRRERNLQWLAIAAAMVLAALVIGGLMSTRLLHGSIPAHPRPLPQTTPVSDYGPPPAGVALIYVAVPNHPGWYTGFDWTGIPRGTIKVAQPLDPSQALIQSPDGSEFEISQSGKPGVGGELLDRLGNPVSGTGSQIWADDNKHMCGVAFDQHAITWTLVTGGPGQATRNVALIAKDPNLGQIGISLAACSFKNDRAIAVRTTNFNPTEMWVIRLSTGQVLSHNTISGGQLAGLVASSDGTLTAENSGRSAGKLGPVAPSTVVRRQSDGSVVRSLDPTLGVLSFSSDDTLALVTTSPQLNGNPTHLAVVDLSTGTIVWRYDGDEWLAGFLSGPARTGFAIMFQSPTDTGGSHPKVSVVLVSGQGALTTIPSTYDRP